MSDVYDSESFGYTFALCAVSTVALDVIFFVLATILKSDKLKDVAGGCAFSMVALLSFFINIQLKVCWTCNKFLSHDSARNLEHVLLNVFVIGLGQNNFNFDPCV